MTPGSAKPKRDEVRSVDVLRLVQKRFPVDHPARLLIEAWPARMSAEEARIRAADVLAVLAAGSR
jgi:hypothetical protein